MTGPGKRTNLRKRRADRNRRVHAWGLRALAGAAAGGLLWLVLGGPVGAALGFTAAAAGLAWGHRFMIAPPGVPVLTYHSVSPDSSWLPWAPEIAVHPETLRAHVETIARMGRHIVSTKELTAARRAGAKLPGRPVVLHFDDGYFDNWLYAAPVLRAHAAPATFFASLDFVAPGETVRQSGDHRGYMNWAELAALDAEPLFEVEPHGVDHGRVPVSPRAVGRLTEQNWRDLAWMQWAAMPGPKHDWYMHDTPPAVPIGTLIPESEGALAAPAYANGRRESGEGYRARVADHLQRCITAWETRLGRRPHCFCWPENRVSATAREIADTLGFETTTAGEWRNTAAEPPHILSRIHAGDCALGFRWGPAERLRIRAAIRLFEGNHYWYLVAAPMDLTRRLVFRLRDPAARRRR